MALIRNAAILLLIVVAGYVGWIVALNLPGERSAAPDPESAAVTPAMPAARHAARTSHAAAAPGALVIPVAGVRRDQLGDTFGDGRGGGRSHQAIDIMAPRGTPVLAAAAGAVEKLFDSRLGGRTIYIRRPGGEWIDYYAHLDSYAPGLAEGQRIARGQMIGTVGSTGDASAEAPHLHYAVHAMAPGEGWWQGKPVNPYPLLRAGGER